MVLKRWRDIFEWSQVFVTIGSRYTITNPSRKLLGTFPIGYEYVYDVMVTKKNRNNLCHLNSQTFTLSTINIILILGVFDVTASTLQAPSGVKRLVRFQYMASVAHYKADSLKTSQGTPPALITHDIRTGTARTRQAPLGLSTLPSSMQGERDSARDGEKTLSRTQTKTLM